MIIERISSPKIMIVRKQLQLLIYTFQIICILGNISLINSEGNGTTEILSLNRLKYSTSSKVNNTYLEISRNAENFSDKICDQTEPLLHDGTFNIPQYDSSTLNSNENSAESFEIELLLCNTTDHKKVQNLTVDYVSTEWVYLSWQPPCENALNESFTYLIYVCLNETCVKANASTTQYNATNLDPCSEYLFTVIVVDKHPEPVGVSAEAKTDYNITEIGEIQGMVVHTTTNTINLSWKEPSKYPTCVQGYMITKCSDDVCNNITVTNTYYLAKNLEPCTEYFFIIKAVSYLVQSSGHNITLKTNSPKPSRPQEPTVKVSAFSLNIVWQPPKVGSMCVAHYRVTITPELKTIIITGTNVTVDGLHACTSYDVYITAVDEDNNDGDMLSINASTASTVSRPPILTEFYVTMNSIMLSWKIEKGNSSCILNSLKATCNYTASAGHGYDHVNGNVEEPINSCIQDEFMLINSVMKDLSPFTTYICWAYVNNEAGVSELSELTKVDTEEDIPSAPIMNIRNITYSQFTLAWEQPTYLAGNLQEFEIIMKWEIHFPTPDWCPLKPSNDTIYLNGSTFIYDYPKAIPHTNYTLKIRAKTKAGWGNYGDDIVFQTPAGVSGMVSNFSYLIKNNENNKNTLDTILKWGFPCSLNGIMEYFNIFVHGTRRNYTPHSFMIKKLVENNINKNDIISINLNELKAEYNYTFEISVKVKEVKKLGVPAKHNVLYPAGIPSQPDEDYIKSITLDPSKAQRTTTSATLLLPLFPDTNGDIIYYSIIVSRIEYNTASNTRFNFTNHTWPNISSWEESMLQDFSVPYQTTRLWWDPYPNHVADYGEVKAVKYTVGEELNCQEFSSNTNKKVYCNGPLKSNTWYHVRMRAFTRGGYADSTTFVIKTNADVNIGLVIGVIFGILFFGVLTTMMLLVRKCSPQVIIWRFLHSDMSGSPVPTPFTKKKFIAHCQQLIENPGKLSNEFQLLQTLSVDLQMPANTACLQANRKKNRYSDILPYDFSRVKLEVIDNDPNTDYINASFIKGYSGEDEYIACQGPKEETTFDFWRMIEQYDVNIIVMLTDLIENGKEKCYQYFPIIKETFRYENMTIRCTSELEYRSYTQRTLVLQKENKKRNITHLHFKEWPDHDIPEGFDSMINFCQIVRRYILANKGYLVVHCSAGIGRTGTLIALDILLQHLRDNRKLDVFGTVYRLRHHRINMVQKESQYAYIYNFIKQVLKNPYCLKTYKPPPMNPSYKNSSKRNKHGTTFKYRSGQEL
ncbi:receptor-type tyrosine-protein phosphatase H isoform X2 [Megachile rotundata]|uniref:receptor-type tyrosine-protein phosphatase H isoform X2 n=1 Tax=Megachile rotundata TaxID=143995 RepID=UPI003FD55862